MSCSTLAKLYNYKKRNQLPIISIKYNYKKYKKRGDILLKKLADGTVIDTVTGEVMIEETIYRKSNEGVKTYNIPLQSKFEEERTIAWKTGHKFVKIYVDSVREVIPELTSAETFAVMSVISYIDYYSNMLKAVDKTPLNTADISTITGFSEKHTINLMDSLVTKKIFARTRVGRSYQYFANPFIFTKGNRINATLFAMFKNYKSKKT